MATEKLAHEHIGEETKCDEASGGATSPDHDGAGNVKAEEKEACKGSHRVRRDATPGDLVPRDGGPDGQSETHERARTGEPDERGSDVQSAFTLIEVVPGAACHAVRKEREMSLVAS